MEEESNGGLAFLDTLLKRNNEKISVLVYRKSTHTDQYIHSALTMKEIATKMLFPPCLIEHIPLSRIQMTYTKKTLEKIKC